MISGSLDSPFANLYSVFWIQRGCTWFAQIEGNLEAAEQLALVMEVRIAGLP